MDQARERLINFIQRCSITSTQLADALGKTGNIPLCMPVDPSVGIDPICGTIKPLFCANGSNLILHDQLRSIPESSICVIFTYNCDNIAVIGELMCDYIFMKRKAKALVVHGLIRDKQEISIKHYPVWAMGSTPIGCSNKIGPAFPEDRKVELIEKYEGSVAVCDITGVVAIPNHRIKDASVIRDLERVSLKERIWSRLINHHNLTTYEVIGQEVYLSQDFDVQGIGAEETRAMIEEYILSINS